MFQLCVVEGLHVFMFSVCVCGGGWGFACLRIAVSACLCIPSVRLIVSLCVCAFFRVCDSVMGVSPAVCVLVYQCVSVWKQLL